MTQATIYPLSEQAITVKMLGTLHEAHLKVLTLNKVISEKPFEGMIETVPAYISLTVFYRPEQILTENTTPFDYIKKHIENLLRESSMPIVQAVADMHRIVNIPVCYDDEFALDLDFIAETHHLDKNEVIKKHSEKEYSVYMMGFMPGFAYMAEVDAHIATPRKSTPRALIEKGSVGIAGSQTGIYPLNSPGGWQIIGKTPLSMFSPKSEKPFLLEAGDTVKFYPISKTEFEQFQDKSEVSDDIKPPKNANAVVLKSGFFSIFQDGGRQGFQRFGVPISGAMDTIAAFQANFLCGNGKNDTVIECTMGGLAIQFFTKTLIAVTGYGAVFLNNMPIALYKTIEIRENDIIEIRFNNQGLRSYLAVQGGFETPQYMGSSSTYLKAFLGSLIKKGEHIYCKNNTSDWSGITISLPIPHFNNNPKIRVFKGNEYDWMTHNSCKNLFSQTFTLTNQSDRMGYRLQSEPLELENKSELLSTAVTKGTIQLTPNGQLIVLMSDCQTCGGYPRVAQVAWVDLPLLAQIKPNDSVQFVEISFEEAESLYLKQSLIFR